MTEYANPLRDVQDRRLPLIAGPSTLVMFGVTGDLARKKLMPAIYDLANRGLLPPGFSLVGFARRDWATQDFAKVVHDSVKEHARTGFREEVWKQLSQGFRFVPGDFSDDQPRQGDGAEHPGPALRQPDVRADLEQPLRRPRADHDGRGHRHRRTGRVLRRRTSS